MCKIDISNEIIKGHFLSRTDNLDFLLTTELSCLCDGADLIRRHFCGDHVDLCSIINGRSGRCSENCKFCAQSAHHNTSVEEYAFLSPDEIVEDGKYHEAAGVHRYSIVTAGRSLEGKDLDTAILSYGRLARESRIKLCASHGLLSDEAFVKLKNAGVDRYHANIETSRRNFPNICTTHTYQDKCENIRRAQKAGLEICSGGIIGMGETWADRIDMALDLSEMCVESIPLNILQPIPGTPYADLPPLSEEDILRTIAIFRYLNPAADIRLAAGRIMMSDSGQKAFQSGANATITGDMLTTSGNNIAQDKTMLTEMGFSI